MKQTALGTLWEEVSHDHDEKLLGMRIGLPMVARGSRFLYV